MKSENHLAEIERIEKKALDDLFEQAPETLRAQLGLERHRVAGGTLYLARREPNILLNRVLGMEPESAADIDAVQTLYREAGITEYFVQVQPWSRPAPIWTWLFEAGLARSRGWTQFIRDGQSVELPDSPLRVEKIDAGQATAFARIAAAGFDLCEKAVPLVAGLVGHPAWHHFMTFLDEQPVGAAALRVEDGVGWFDWSATRSEFRGRGSQTLLLATRIRKANELGCHTLCSETGEAVPGDPQHSFHNLVRAGFRPTHTRDNFAPAAVTDASGRIPLAQSS